jgi:hypothetical protein
MVLLELANVKFHHNISLGEDTDDNQAFVYIGNTKISGSFQQLVNKLIQEKPGKLRHYYPNNLRQ